MEIKHLLKTSILALEDGSFFEGYAIGASGRGLGEVVFNTDETNKGWNGRHNGKPAPSDIYIFKASVFYENEEMSFEGNVTLLR